VDEAPAPGASPGTGAGGGAGEAAAAPAAAANPGAPPPPGTEIGPAGAVEPPLPSWAPPAAADAPAGAPAASQRIAGYLLDEQIGLGGMAVVYRATDERLGRRVALKLLAPALAEDAGFRQRFIRESRAAAAVDHPNIIPIYEAGEIDGALFIAMRYVHGGDVRSLLERENPLSPGRAWSIVGQVASALDAAHSFGLVHRDVKPGNMLLDASGGRGWGTAGQSEHVYLSDFGISKLQMASAALTQTGQFVGTLDYIAPEQIENQRIDGRADQYSLACAAFELLSGTRPFRKDTQLGLITAHLAAITIEELVAATRISENESG